MRCALTGVDLTKAPTHAARATTVFVILPSR